MPSGIYKHQPHTQETKDKISKVHIGVKKKSFTQMHKDNMSKAHLGMKRKPHTQETKNKIGKSVALTLARPEVKEKMRISQTGHTQKHKDNIGKGVTLAMARPEVKEKMRTSHIGKTVGKNNGMFGKGYLISGESNARFGKHPYNYIEKPSEIQLYSRMTHECHEYVKIMNGPAELYCCVDCGKQAHDWSNINNHRYRKNANDYVPRCRSCHVKYDFALTNKE